MSIIQNLSEVSDVYLGSENIENIYLGEDLLWTAETSPYTPDQVIFEQATAGTYSLDILADGKYEVYVIGGGASASHWCSGKTGTNGAGYSGGSGAGFIGIINLEVNTYVLTIGNGGAGTSGNTGSRTGPAGGNSSIENLVVAYGAPSHGPQAVGNGGALPTINTTIISQTLNSAGNAGRYGGTGGTAGGASVYNGYGAGGASGRVGGVGGIDYSGANGYVKIVYKGK